MNVIIQELKDLLKTKSIGTDSDQALLLDFQETLGTIYLMTANLSQAKTHFKRAFKIYEKIWADENSGTGTGIPRHPRHCDCAGLY